MAELDESILFSQAGYADAHSAEVACVDVPICEATAESLSQYGHLVHDMDKEEVQLEPWPHKGRRKIMQGTGTQAGIINDDFRMWHDGEYVFCANVGAHADYCAGRAPKGESPSNKCHVLVRDANYHPDGGQVFFPKSRDPFVALLALPGDDVTPEDFRAFYFKGGTGVQIKPFIWHQSPYPVRGEMVFRNKQNANYAIVPVDVVQEFGKFLRLPLNLPGA